jgi:hypothetical protein
VRKRGKQKIIKCGREINRIKESEKEKNRRREREKAKETEEKKLRKTRK